MSNDASSASEFYEFFNSENPDSDNYVFLIHLPDKLSIFGHHENNRHWP